MSRGWFDAPNDFDNGRARCSSDGHHSHRLRVARVGRVLARQEAPAHPMDVNKTPQLATSFI